MQLVINAAWLCRINATRANQGWDYIDAIRKIAENILEAAKPEGSRQGQDIDPQT